MSEKPEAIRLAEWIEEDMSCLGDAEIAAELRRMHAELQIAHNKNNELQEALQQIKPHATQPAEATQAEVTDSMIREAFLANGFTIKDGHSDLKPYVYAAARAILALRPERVPMTDDQISLEAHNADDRDWNDLRFRSSWHEGFLEGARFAEAHHVITAQAKEAEAQQPATPEPVAWNSIQIASWIGSQLMHEPSMFERATVCKFVRSLGRHPTLIKHSPKTHPAPSVPDGYALVPIEPTQAMLKVQTWDFNRFYSPREIWAAMLAAK